MYIPKTDTEWPKVPTGNYPATIADITEAEGQYGPQLRVEFELGDVETVDGEVQSVKLSSWTSQKFTGGKKPSKLWTLVAAAGLSPDAMEGLDVAELIGRKVRLTVTEEPRRDGDGIYNRIVAFLPVAARKAATNGHAKAPARQAAPADADDDGDPF